jgi:hypothetical protein
LDVFEVDLPQQTIQFLFVFPIPVEDQRDYQEDEDDSSGHAARYLHSVSDALLPSEAAGGGGDRGLTPHPINRVRDVKNLRTNPVLDNVNIFVDVTVKHIT